MCESVCRKIYAVLECGVQDLCESDSESIGEFQLEVERGSNLRGEWGIYAVLNDSGPPSHQLV